MYFNLRRPYDYLYPHERLIELIYGLVIALAITNSVRLVGMSGTVDIDLMVQTALGAGIAWGIIDALLYLVVIVYERNRYIHVADDLQDSKDEKAALGIIQEDLEDSIIGTLDVEDQERIYKDVLGAQRRVGYADKARGASSLGREDYLGAFQVFLAMLVATLVVVVPLLVVKPPHVAVIASNLVALVSLFVVGYLWARHTRINKVKFGLLLAVMGAGIVIITFFLGG